MARPRLLDLFCAKCGHSLEAHTARGCRAMEGLLECKCYRPRIQAEDEAWRRAVTDNPPQETP